MNIKSQYVTAFIYRIVLIKYIVIDIMLDESSEKHYNCWQITSSW